MAKENESTMKWKVDIAQLKAAMTDAKRSISLANAEFKTATAGMDKWQKSTTGVEAKIKQLNSVLPQQKTILAQLEKQYEITAKEMGEDSDAANKLRLQIENQKATIVATEASINKYNNQLDQMQKEEKAAESPMNQLNKTIAEQEDQMKELKKSYADAVLQSGKNSKEAKTLAKEIDSLSGELNQNKKKSKEASDAADSLDKNVDKAGKTADKATDKFKGLSNLLGSAVKGALVGFGTAVAGAVTGLTSASVSAASYADEINTMSTVTGISTEKLQTYKYAAELVDVSLETLTGSMTKNIRSMTSAQKGTGSAAEAYKRLGVAVVDSKGNLRDSETVFWEAIDALGKIEDQTTRDSISMQIFGKSAQDLNPLIQAGSSAMAEYGEEAKRMGAVLSDDQLTNLNAFDDSVQRLKSGAGAIKNALGTLLLPVLQTLSDEGTKLLGDFTNGIIEADGDWSKISTVVGDTVKGLSGIVAKEFPKILKLGISALSSLGSALIKSLPSIIQTLTDSVVKDGLKDLLTAILESAPLILDTLLGLIVDLANWLASGDTISTLIQGVIQLVTAVAESLTNVLPILLPVLVQIIGQIADELTKPENVNLILDALLTLVGACAVAIVKSIPTLIKALGTVFTNIWNRMKDESGKLIAYVVVFLQNIKDKLIAWVNDSSIFKNISSFVTNILNIIRELPSKVIEIGSNVVKGIWNGISKSYDWIKGKIKEWVGNITTFFKKALGISSPSKLMADAIGQFMPEGVALGFEKDMPAALSKMKKSMTNAISDLKTDVSLSAEGLLSSNVSGSSISGAKQQTINFNQTINSPKAVDGLTLYRQTNSLLFAAKVGMNNV